MAKKVDKKEKKIVLERVYNVPLRKKYQRAPRWKRTNRAVSALRQFIIKNMKSGEVKIGTYLNTELWKHGIRNPPHHIKVNCKKDEDGIVRVELVGAPEEKLKEEPKKKAKETEEDTEIEIKDALGGEDVEKKSQKSKISEGLETKSQSEIKEEKAKTIQKKEIKELKKAPKTRAPKQPKMPKRVEQHPTAPMQKG